MFIEEIVMKNKDIPEFFIIAEDSVSWFSCYGSNVKASNLIIF
jgi:hypothetical protein